jgi:hypothetical protein
MSFAAAVRQVFGFDHQDRHRDVVPHAVRRAAADDVVEQAMAVGGHRDQIDVLGDGDADELGRGIPTRQVRPRGEARVTNSSWIRCR